MVVSVPPESERKIGVRQFVDRIACGDEVDLRDRVELLYHGSVVSLPVREHITLPIQEQLIVELYSK